jgi:hypothetical protein
MPGVDAAFDASAWSDFAVMVGGASAALAGLIGVALSISVEQILASAYLPRRAAGALLLTITPLVVAVILLVPDQSTTAVGVELLVAGGVLGAALAVAINPKGRSSHQSLPVWGVGTALPAVLLIASILVAGIGVVTESLGGLYWLPPGLVLALLGGVLQAWVLLIEIRR